MLEWKGYAQPETLCRHSAPGGAQRAADIGGRRLPRRPLESWRAACEVPGGYLFTEGLHGRQHARRCSSKLDSRGVR